MEELRAERKSQGVKRETIGLIVILAFPLKLVTITAKSLQRSRPCQQQTQESRVETRLIYFDATLFRL